MMEHYNTQATEVNHLWRQGLRELALKQARAMDLSRPQAPDLGKTLHGMWQHLILQGWNQIFTPPPHQQDYSGAEAQQNPANEVPEKEIDDSESRAASVEVAENNKQTWEPFRKFSEEKRSEESHEKKQKDAHSISEAEVWERSSLLGNGMEIRPEAPILRTELPRDDLILTEKEFLTSGRESEIAPEALGINVLNKGIERPFCDENQYKEAPSKEHLKSRVSSLEYCEIYDSRLPRKRSWYQIFLQRWKLAFDPSERQEKDAKQKKKKAVKAELTWLYEYFPDSFSLDDIKPLKLYKNNFFNTLKR